MSTKESNFAYIDGTNLHKAIKELGWDLDYTRFRIWLKHKYKISRAYIFLGRIPKNQSLYTFLQEAGFILIFKETTYDGDGKAKGNCDAEMVLHAVRDYYENKFDQAVIVTGDGDFSCLASFLLEKEKLKTLVAPNSKKCSYLLRRLSASIVYLSNVSLLQKIGLEIKRKSPR